MGKRPHLEMIRITARVPRGHDGFWQIIRELDQRQGSWSLADVDGRSNVDTGSIRDFIARLVKAGFAVVDRHDMAGQPPVPRPIYRLVRNQVDTPRLRRDGTELPEPQQQTIWRTMRMLKEGTASEVASTAAMPGRSVPRAVAHRYLRQLVAAGILTVAATGAPGRESRYRLLRDIGPRAPMILRLHVVFDPNAGVVLGEPAAREVSP